jgi:hypothetical protein
MIVLYNRRTSLATIQQRHPDAAVLDLTSRGPQPWVRFSPFYPHGSIPVPFSPGQFSASVEGIWQGLKVFERSDVDPRKFLIISMNNLKRSTRSNGNVLGHRQGVDGTCLLAYKEARYQIYLPSYAWVLEHALQDQIADLKRLEQQHPLVFLDYETNEDINSLSKPLSHAGLVKRYMEGRWPTA